MKRNDYKLGDLVKQFANSDKIKPGLYQRKVEQAWGEIMGPWIKKETAAINIKDGRLTLTIHSAALRQELHYSREQIRERMNEFLGEDYIQSVHVR